MCSGFHLSLEWICFMGKGSQFGNEDRGSELIFFINLLYVGLSPIGIFISFLTMCAMALEYEWKGILGLGSINNSF